MVAQIHAKRSGLQRQQHADPTGFVECSGGCIQLGFFQQQFTLLRTKGGQAEAESRLIEVAQDKLRGWFVGEDGAAQLLAVGKNAA